MHHRGQRPPPGWVDYSTYVGAGREVNHEIPAALARAYGLRGEQVTPTRLVARMQVWERRAPQCYTFEHRFPDEHVDRWFVRSLPDPTMGWEIHAHPDNRVRELVL